MADDVDQNDDADDYEHEEQCPPTRAKTVRAVEYFIALRRNWGCGRWRHRVHWRKIRFIHLRKPLFNDEKSCSSPALVVRFRSIGSCIVKHKVIEARPNGESRYFGVTFPAPGSLC